jgi:hypothetical protein
MLLMSRGGREDDLGVPAHGVRASGYPLMVPDESETTGRSLAQHEQTPIRQPRLGGFHPLTQLHQIACEAPIIEGTQFDGDPVRAPHDAARQPEEGRQPVPGRLGVGAWEVRVSGPHDQIRQGQLEHGHRLILGVVEFIHGPFARRQILQLSEQVALLLAGSLAGIKSRHDGVFGFPLALLERGELGSCLLLEHLTSFALSSIPRPPVAPTPEGAR